MIDPGQNLPRQLQGKGVLVTGAGGYLAADLLGRLFDVDCRLTCLSRAGQARVPAGGAASVDLLGGDLCEAATWDRALDGIDIVFHLAAQTSAQVADEDPETDFESNVRPMLELLESCRRLKRRPCILFAGTVTQTGIPATLPVDEAHPDDPITVYDRHKLMAEQHLNEAIECGDVHGASLRLPNVYGPGPSSSAGDRGILNRMIRQACAGNPLTIYGRGEKLRDYIFIEDVTFAFLAAAQQAETLPRGHFVIGTGDGTSIADAFRLVADRVARGGGPAVEVRHVDPPPLSPIEGRDFIADPRKFSSATGWQARVSLADGIDRTVKVLT